MFMKILSQYDIALILKYSHDADEVIKVIMTH